MEPIIEFYDFLIAFLIGGTFFALFWFILGYYLFEFLPEQNRHKLPLRIPSPDEGQATRNLLDSLSESSQPRRVTCGPTFLKCIFSLVGALTSFAVSLLCLLLNLHFFTAFWISGVSSSAILFTLIYWLYKFTSIFQNATTRT
jgi:hypothetical protein